MKKPADSQLSRAFSAAAKPRRSKRAWGLYVYSDAPPIICGSGKGHFLWFPTRRAMADFVRLYLAWFHPGPSSMEESDIAAEVQRIVQSHREDQLEEMRCALNEFMRCLWQIEWWGCFGELCDGEGDFPQEMRRWFYDVEDVDSVEYVPLAKASAFAQSLAEYGT